MRSIETDYSPPTFSGIGERDVYTYFDMGYLLICINFTIWFLNIQWYVMLFILIATDWWTYENGT